MKNTKTFKCKNCGKEYKNEIHYKKHIKNCKNIIKDKNVEIPITIPVEIPKIIENEIEEADIKIINDINQSNYVLYEVEKIIKDDTKIEDVTINIINKIDEKEITDYNIIDDIINKHMKKLEKEQIFDEKIFRIKNWYDRIEGRNRWSNQEFEEGLKLYNEVSRKSLDLKPNCSDCFSRIYNTLTSVLRDKKIIK